MEVLDSFVLKSSLSDYHLNRKTSATSTKSSFFGSHVCLRRENRIPSFRKLKLKVGNYGFEDEGHMDYYSRNSPVCGEKKGRKGWSGISTKKRMKLLKGLVKDLSNFSELGFGLELKCDHNQGFVADDKSKTMSQAAEILLGQLKQLRAEEEEMKKKEKEMTENCKSHDCESSSSSSESSDSECDEVIDMKCVKKSTIVQPIKTKDSNTFPEQPVNDQVCENTEQSCNMILEMTLNKDAGIQVLSSETLNLNQSKLASIEKKIEVCMGGKCKKSGSPALKEEFQRVMGDEGVVVGCKCMGKCKSAPNVIVVNASVADNVGGDDSLRTPSNAVCIGVGLEDVRLIVANYLGDDELRIAVAGVPS